MNTIPTAVACALLAGAGWAQQTWYVDVNGAPPGSGGAADPYTSLQYAIEQPSTSNGDTLLVLPGTYDERIDFVGKAIEVRSTAGAPTTLLRGDPMASPPSSVVTFTSGEGAGSVLAGFTIRDGNGTLVAGKALGGGVYVSDSDPTLVDCVVRENAADLGGGGAFVRATPTLTGCDFENNLALEGGGGLHFAEAGYSDIVLVDCRIRDNVSQNGPGGGVHVDFFFLGFDGCEISGNRAEGLNDGGGVYFDDGFISFGDCVLSGNSARNGGAVFLSAAFGGAAADCLFEGNTASGNGAGLYTGLSSMYARDCTFRGNRAQTGSGGGILSFTTDLDLHRCVFDSNFADDFGGGVYYVPTTSEWRADLTHCTVVRNETTYSGGGVYGYGYLSVTNGILWGNTPDDLVGTAYATVNYSDVGGGYAGTGNIDADPLFWDAGGGDLQLRPRSPCVDAGDPTSPPDPDGSVADMGAHPLARGHCPEVSSYCTAGTTASGCNALIGATGIPSATAPSGFDVSVTGVEGQQPGILFWGVSAKAAPWGAGSSFLCVQAPTVRTSQQQSGGTVGACDGSFALDFNAWMRANPGKALGVGEVVYLQAWFRDPPSPKTTSLSNGLRFVVCH